MLPSYVKMYKLTLYICKDLVDNDVGISRMPTLLKGSHKNSVTLSIKLDKRPVYIFAIGDLI